MSNITPIHANKTPRRIHFIPEWAEKRGLKQKDIVEELDVDKGLVSKWFNKGVLPKPEYLDKLCILFQLEEVGSLFRDPEDDWLAQFFRDKTEEQKEKAVQMLKLMFEDIKTGTDG
ncbi:helix-turn-helix transcriptional regulator [Rhizobium oryzihabitans]|uniref:Helix-turn-helix transcriptional regulator n=1 Tax=Rhizobium oryzihabitans TaxID=2267833 RepID=A0A7L5BDH9_9HYPH|nr:helix-turn-helix transcriptional regulator [Rhizobium oryzihabitans]QIB36930.1 helix-turn-helix transcriptional regulator [Rhizobium oryzihabitans]